MKKTQKKTAPKTVLKPALPKKKTAAASASRKKTSAKSAAKKSIKPAAAKRTKAAEKNSAAKKPVKKIAGKTVKKSVKKTVKKTNPAITPSKKTVEKKIAEKTTARITAAKTAGKVSVKPNLKKVSAKKGDVKNPAKLTKPVGSVQVKKLPKAASNITSVKNMPSKKAVARKVSEVKPQAADTKIYINAFLPPEKPEQEKPKSELFSVERVQEYVVNENIVQEDVVQEKAAERMVKDAYSAEELRTFEQKLRQLRSQLRGDFDNMTGSALSQNHTDSGELSSAPTHPADFGTDNFEQEQTFAFIQSRSERLEDVDDALERIKDGTYGVCERCNCKIPKARLNYLPYVTMCVKCTEIAERETE